MTNKEQTNDELIKKEKKVKKNKPKVEQLSLIHTYAYKAIKANGKKAKGKLSVPDEDVARNILQAKRYEIISIKEEKEISLFKSKRKPIKKDILIDMLETLASFLASGIRMDEALLLLTQQYKDKNTKEVLYRIYKLVLDGNSLSAAIASFDVEFPPMLKSMIYTGELSANLVEILETSAKYFTNMDKIKKEIKSIYIGPLIYLTMTFGVLIFMIWFVFPTYETLFSSFGGGVPGYIKIFLDARIFVEAHKIQVFLVIAGIISSIVFVTHNKKCIIKFQRWSLELPVISQVVKLYYQSFMAVTLYQLIKSKVKLLSAVEVTAPLMTHVVYKELADEMYSHLVEGKEMSEPLEGQPAFDDLFVKTIANGEKTGDLTTAFKNLNTYYDKTVFREIAKIKKIINPLLMLFIYGIILYLVIAVMLPSITVIGEV